MRLTMSISALNIRLRLQLQMTANYFSTTTILTEWMVNFNHHTMATTICLK